jgi:hypothetical protein
MNELVERLQAEILKQPQAEGSVRHTFMPGIYMRELTIPAGVVSVGHKHRYNHISMLVKGRITVLNTDGSLTELTAPLTMISFPGKKCAYAYEECIWINVHAANCTDVETIEALIYDLSASPDRIKELPSEIKQVVCDDYQEMLTEYNLTEAEVQVETLADNVMPTLYGVYKCKVSDSKIHGKGIFATGNIQDGETIAPVFMGGMRTFIGRYLNHSGSPNAKVVKAPDGGTYLVAMRYIQGCLGGNDGEEITTNYRDTLLLLGRSPCQVG